MKKYVRDSYTEQAQILTQCTLNGNSRLFGGQMMEWIDITAAIAARRHSGRNVTTVAVDSLEFKGPAYANDTVLLTAKITYVGKTSMEVCVKSYVEELNGDKKLINIAYVVMVALDEFERPADVPGLIIETEEERCDWEMGRKRYLIRKERKNDASCT
ncbi:MAG: acyl-CoA thioesterase [Clostridia bacterium]|jgi:acyl-CoA hydrolase